MSHPLAALVRELRAVFRRETLPPPQPDAAPRERRSIARLLLAPEPLPRDEAPPVARKRSVLALLFAPEPLELEPPLPPRRSRGLAWLLLPERVEDDPRQPDSD